MGLSHSSPSLRITRQSLSIPLEIFTPNSSYTDCPVSCPGLLIELKFSVTSLWNIFLFSGHAHLFLFILSTSNLLTGSLVAWVGLELLRLSIECQDHRYAPPSPVLFRTLGDQMQGFIQAKQTFYQLSCIPQYYHHPLLQFATVSDYDFFISFLKQALSVYPPGWPGTQQRSPYLYFPNTMIKGMGYHSRWHSDRALTHSQSHH